MNAFMTNVFEVSPLARAARPGGDGLLLLLRLCRDKVTC